MDLAVIDPLPMYRHGVIAVLSAAGYQVGIPTDPLDWARESHAGLMLLTLANATDWNLLGRVRQDAPERSVIAVFERGSRQAWACGRSAGGAVGARP